MHVNDVSRHQFSKIASRRFAGQMTLTGRGLVLGAGTLLAKLDGKALPSEADQERIWTLLSVAYGEKTSLAVLGSLRRVAKHWHGGDKCLAAIHLAQMGLPEIGEDAAYRLALAAALLDAGVAPRALAQELGFSLVQFGVSKYDENQPRVPAGSGRESGQWTSGDAAAGDDASSLIEGRSAAANSANPKHVRGVPNDAIVVTRPDGTPIDDPASPTGKLMAPPRANFREVYAEGTKKPTMFQINEDVGHFGRFDYQRDKASNTFYPAYKHASNYAVGVFMAGAGYTREKTSDIAETFAYFYSSNYATDKAERQYWTYRGWDDAHEGIWK